MSVTAIQDEVLGLPATERARLMDLLWGSFSKPEQQARERPGRQNQSVALTPLTPVN